MNLPKLRSDQKEGARAKSDNGLIHTKSIRFAYDEASDRARLAPQIAFDSTTKKLEKAEGRHTDFSCSLTEAQFAATRILADPVRSGAPLAVIIS